MLKKGVLSPLPEAADRITTQRKYLCPGTHHQGGESMPNQAINTDCYLQITEAVQSSAHTPPTLSSFPSPPNMPFFLTESLPMVPSPVPY